MQEKTKRNTLAHINGGYFQGELYTPEGKDNYPIEQISRSYFYNGQMVTQRINYPVRYREELIYILTQLGNETAKQNGSDAPAPDGVKTNTTSP